MLISIIIPAFNEEAILGQTIEQIKLAFSANDEVKLLREIIVCDNNSTDKTAAIATQRGVQVVFEPNNQISQARNAGARAASGEWLLFIDADSHPRPELVAELAGIIEGNTYVGCGTTVEVQGGTLFNKLRMERLNPLFRLFNLCGGAFLFCRRDAYRAIGGFSTELYAYEEIDFAFRLKKHGRKQDQKFITLHRHPVITSGRKGEYTLSSLGSLYVSNFVAVILFGLYYLIPKRVVRSLGARTLGYWYNGRR